MKLATTSFKTKVHVSLKLKKTNYWALKKASYRRKIRYWVTLRMMTSKTPCKWLTGYRLEYRLANRLANRYKLPNQSMNLRRRKSLQTTTPHRTRGQVCTKITICSIISTTHQNNFWTRWLSKSPSTSSTESLLAVATTIKMNSVPFNSRSSMKPREEEMTTRASCCKCGIFKVKWSSNAPCKDLFQTGTSITTITCSCSRKAKTFLTSG